MIKRKKACITADTETMTLRLGAADEVYHVQLPPGVFGDGEAMAATFSENITGEALLHIRQSLRHADIVLLVNSDRAVCRIETMTPIPMREWPGAAREVLKRHFPEGGAFDETTYVMDWHMHRAKNGDIALFLAALPIDLVEGLTHLCYGQGLQIPLVRLKRIDLIENTLLAYYGGLYDTAVWLCFAQERGVRVLSLNGGLPKACWSIDNDPLWREQALLRLWAARDEAQTPENVILAASDQRLSWMGTFLRERGVTVTEIDAPDVIAYNAYNELN